MLYCGILDDVRKCDDEAIRIMQARRDIVRAAVEIAKRKAQS